MLEKYLKKEQLRWWLTKTTDEVFAHFHARTINPDDKLRRHIFIDNDSPVLMVCHIDHVRPIEDDPLCSDKRIVSRNLDDRLGCALLWQLANGPMKADILLTDLEEKGMSTAQHFITEKKYSWVVEFDRAGEDVVTYDIDNAEWKELLRGEGFTIGRGAFSDICSLDLPGTPCAMNIGIGYKHAHQDSSWACVAEMNRQVEKAIAFYGKYKDTYFQADELPPLAGYTGHAGSHGWHDWEEGLSYVTPLKRKKSTKNVWQCPVCESYMFEHQVGINGACVVCDIEQLVDVTKEMMEV